DAAVVRGGIVGRRLESQPRRAIGVAGAGAVNRILGGRRPGEGRSCVWLARRNSSIAIIDRRFVPVLQWGGWLQDLNSKPASGCGECAAALDEKAQIGIGDARGAHTGEIKAQH